MPVRNTPKANGAAISIPADLTAQQRSLLALMIDVPYYAAQSGMGFSSSEDLVEHYLTVGWQAGFDPTTTFVSVRYTNATPVLREPVTNPFVHYLFEHVGEEPLLQAFGELSTAEIAALRARFDADWYGRNNPDVAATAGDPFIHYMTTGWRGRRDPSPVFSTGGYLDLHADIREHGINPFRHWVIYGIAEGRSSGAAGAATSSLEAWEGLSSNQQLILTRMFDIDYYRLNGADADPGDGLSPAQRVVSGGTGRQLTPSFHEARYVAAHPEIRATRKIPLLWYLFVSVGENALRDLFVSQECSILQKTCAQFDAAWYLYSYPDIEASGQDAFIHYMTVGWREYRDPSQNFSTRAYLLRYPDIVDAGINPFLHWITYGQAEGRSGASSASNFRNRAYAPKVTAILVNCDANPLTPESCVGIVSQNYRDLDILIVGVPLPEACHVAINRCARVVRYLPQDGLLPSWAMLECAVAQATGELLWVVQGDWAYDSEFLARLTSSFADNSVQLGFGRCLKPDDSDHAIGEYELARRMEQWARHVTTPAALWFSERLRANLDAPDQNSFLWRRRDLEADIWRQTGEYRVLGFWYLYLHMASGGQIATVRDAVARIPLTSPPAQVLPDVDHERDERTRLRAALRSFWPMSDDADDVAMADNGIKRHVLIVTHGLFAGGAENLPIQMANALAARGVTVSLLIFKIDVNPEMRATLDPGVSIYEADWVMEYGCERFLRDIGCSLIHSHGVIGEMFFFRLCEEALPVPYVCTLHGSYEASSSTELPDWFIAKIVRNVDLFVYTADKNLAPLVRNGVRSERLIKMINAMPIDETSFPLSRAELGIAEEAVVFTLVARGIQAKGWSTAVTAFKAVQKRNPGRSLHLCLVGDGDEPERLGPLHADDPSISFLGFQLRINGLYRMTDVAIVPTRFAGESFPLCIIQALQVNVPVIATDVGEIASMLAVDGVTGGIVVESSSDDPLFDARFADAMHSLIDDARRQRLAAGAALLGHAYDMDRFTNRYLALYEDVIERFAVSRAGVTLDHGQPA